MLDTPNARRGPRTGSVNRKTGRKADRQLAKQRKAQFFSERPVSVKRRLGALSTEEGDRKSKKQKLSEPATVSHSTSALKRTDSSTYSSKTTAKKDASLKSGQPKPSPTKLAVPIAKKTRSRQEENEDAYISMLEKKLGIKRQKSGKSRYGAAFEDDGLLGGIQVD